MLRNATHDKNPSFKKHALLKSGKNFSFILSYQINVRISFGVSLIQLPLVQPVLLNTILLESNFETLIASFIENKVGISNQFLSKELAERLKINLLALNKDKLLVAAGIGNTNNLIHNTAIRSDAIYWLDRKHNNSSETDFLNLVEDFIRYLNISCYAGITSCEFHFSLYEIGSFYKKHLDQFQNNSNRKYSMISYLNEDWQENDGGQLLIYHADSNQKISPEQGKTVFFKSDELPHEVLVTQERRMSVTGWLKSSN